MKIPITPDTGMSQEGADFRRADPLALDPYSPIPPTRAPERDDADPLALSPYSPMLTTRAPVDRSTLSLRASARRAPGHPAAHD